MVAAGCVGPRNMAHDPRHGRLHFNTWPGWNTGHRRAENAGVSSVQFPFHSRFSFMYVPENFHKLAGSRVVIVNAMQVVSVHLCFPSTFPACLVYLCRDFPLKMMDYICLGRKFKRKPYRNHSRSEDDADDLRCRCLDFTMEAAINQLLWCLSGISQPRHSFSLLFIRRFSLSIINQSHLINSTIKGIRKYRAYREVGSLQLKENVFMEMNEL